MRSIEAIYKFGNLYDKKTLKRILIDDGSDIVIAVASTDLLEEDPNLKPEELKSAEVKRQEIEEAMGPEEFPFWKLFEAGSLLYFEITAGVKRRNGKEDISTQFQVRLLEDLYIYNKNKDPKYCRFFDCHCIVEKCLTDFQFFEPLYAKSLNDAYTKTYELYFAMYGKSTCNAFDRYFDNQRMVVPLRGMTEDIQKKASDRIKSETR